ncbi:13060_t:CDS:1, partial [Cetraspora pellucida]
ISVIPVPVFQSFWHSSISGSSSFSISTIKCIKQDGVLEIFQQNVIAIIYH